MKSMSGIIIAIIIVIFIVVQVQIFSLKDEIRENREVITTSTEISGTIVNVLGDLVDSLKGEEE